MKAQDKIYMPNELLSEGWQRHIEGQDTCYINKDTLLEFLQKEKALCQNNSYGIGKEREIQRVIEKIESL